MAHHLFAVLFVVLVIALVAFAFIVRRIGVAAAAPATAADTGQSPATPSIRSDLGKDAVDIRTTADDVATVVAIDAKAAVADVKATL